MPSSRTIRMCSTVVNCSTSYYFETSDPVPTILHVCQESRREALRFYQPLTTGLERCRLDQCSDSGSCTHFASVPLHGQHNNLYINYAHDTIFVDYQYDYYNLSRAVSYLLDYQIPLERISKVQSIALNSAAWFSPKYRRNLAHMYSELRKLPGLKALMIVTQDDFRPRHDHMIRLDLVDCNDLLLEPVDPSKPVMASVATDEVKNWIQERLRPVVLFKDGWAPPTLADPIKELLRFHPWHRHSELIEVLVANAHIPGIINKGCI